jgi:integrase
MINTAVTIQYDGRKRAPWLVRWHGDYDPTVGKQRRYCKGFRRKADAEIFRAQKTASFDSGLKRDIPEAIPVTQFCQDWLAIKQKEIRPGTQKIYEHAIGRLNTFLGPYLLVSQLTPSLAARFIAEQKPMDDSSKKNRRKHPKKKLSDWSRNKILRSCKTMFEDAVEWEMIPKNPFRKTKTPKLIVPAWYYLPPAEYHKLLEAAPSLRWKACYALTYTAGLRSGEMFSLTWKDIDFEHSEITITTRPATETLPPFFVKDFESRRIPLSRHTLDLLTALQAKAPGVPYVLLTEQRYQTILAKWNLYKEDNTKPWRNQDMVNNVGRELNRHLNKAGIKPTGKFSIHTLRKCCCKNWADHLPMHVTKELMGHSPIATTQKYYTQLDKNQLAQAAAVGDLLIGAGSPTTQS